MAQDTVLESLHKLYLGLLTWLETTCYQSSIPKQQTLPAVRLSRKGGIVFSNLYSIRHGLCLSHSPAVTSPTQTTLASLLRNHLFLEFPRLPRESTELFFWPL